MGQAISFLEYFRDTPAKYSRVTNGQLVMVTRELRKLLKDLNRNVLGHQSLVKQGKLLRLVAKEDLAKCQVMAKEKIPSLLGESLSLLGESLSLSLSSVSLSLSSVSLSQKSLKSHFPFLSLTHYSGHESGAPQGPGSLGTWWPTFPQSTGTGRGC